MARVHWLRPISAHFGGSKNWSGGGAPGANDDAILDASGSDYTVLDGSRRTVNSIETASNATLELGGPSFGVTFTATNGTGAGENAGVIEVGAGQDGNPATFAFGGVLNNTGQVIIYAAGGFKPNIMLVVGATALVGGGTLLLDGFANEFGIEENGNDFIEAGTSSATLKNVDNTIAGGGFFELRNLTFSNEAHGIVDADSGAPLFLNGGNKNIIRNAGVLEATAGGLLVPNNLTIANTATGVISAVGVGSEVQLTAVKVKGGALTATGGGYFNVQGGATFDGTVRPVLIEGLVEVGVIPLSVPSTLTLKGRVEFEGGSLLLGPLGLLDLADINFVNANEATYSGTATGGTLTVTDGTYTANIPLTGDYLGATFIASADKSGGTIVAETPSGANAASFASAMASFSPSAAGVVGPTAEPLAATSQALAVAVAARSV